MRISFIATVLNEEATIDQFLKSINAQFKQPDEIIIIDGGSTDNTFSIISNFEFKVPGKNVKVLIKKGNRSVGRNEAVKISTGDIIACSDAGCILDSNWLKNIIEPFYKSDPDVVAGYYKGFFKTIFEKCLIPYVLTMPDKVNPKTFLPASRTIAFTKKIFEKIGGFDEGLFHNEDYDFAKKLKKSNANIVFRKDAIVSLVPRKNFKEAFHMFYRFSKGDAEAKILRPKVFLLFLRYFAGFLLFALFLKTKLNLALFGLLFLFLFYLIWSVLKNYKYIKHRNAFYILPSLQIISDIAIIIGTLTGIIKGRKWLVVITVLYSFTMLSVLNWGIPNLNHPFTYHMDEWHQLQSVRAVFKYGTPNIEGAAHGPMFQFFLSGAYLIPFYIFKIVDPFVVKSALSSLVMQERIFQLLRLNSLIFGALSIIVLAKIAKDYFKVGHLFIILLFAVTPLWLSLGNYFKYDIALIFWMIISIFFILRYISRPSLKSYIFAAIFSSLALATKISAIPLFPVFILSFFLIPKKEREYKHFFLGIATYFLIFILVGIPDVLLGRGSYYEFFYSNLVTLPKETYNYLLGTNYWLFLIFKQFPTIFGKVFSLVFLFSFFCFLFELCRAFVKGKLISYKKELIILTSLVLFALSLIPLKLGATGNRALVLLPFLALISSITLSRFLKFIPSKLKVFLIALIALGISIQVLESFAWVYIKLSIDPRESSSKWILNNIPKRSVIGIENIPIYQMIPDVILKEYYSNRKENNFRYEIVNSSAKRLPNVIIVTNKEIDYNYVINSPKKSLVNRLKKEGYEEKKEFYPAWNYYKVFGDQLNFFISGIVPSPTITIFTKNI